MSKARSLSAFISDPAIDASEIGSNAITTDKILNSAVTADKLHTSLDLSTKTVTFADNHISGNKIHGGVISDFASTGIDDNATATAVTINSSGHVGIGTSNPTTKLDIAGTLGDGSGRLKVDEWIQISQEYNSLPILRANWNTGGASRLYQYSNGTVKNQFLTDGDSYITGGNFGIGTSTPGARLHVKDGHMHLQASNAELKFSDVGGTCKLRMDNGANLAFTNEVNETRVLFSNNGAVTIGSATAGKGLFNIAEQTDDETVVIDNMYVARNFYFSVGGAVGTKTVTVLLEGHALTGHMIDMHMSGHYWNNGASTYYRHSRFYLMRESTSATRINSRQDLFLGGSNTGAIGVPVASYANGYWTITYAVGSGFQHKLHITSTANGSNSIYSISVN